MFVRAGSALPITGAAWLFPDPESGSVAGTWYEDDGTTTAYLRGGLVRFEVSGARPSTMPSSAGGQAATEREPTAPGTETGLNPAVGTKGITAHMTHASGVRDADKYRPAVGDTLRGILYQGDGKLPTSLDIPLHYAVAPSGVADVVLATPGASQ